MRLGGRALVCGVVFLLACSRKKSIAADPTPDAAAPITAACRDEKVFEDGRLVWAPSFEAGVPNPTLGTFQRFVATAKSTVRGRSLAVARAACGVTKGIRECGADADQRQPGFRGVLVLSFDVVDAKLTMAMRAGGTANDLGIEKCAIAALQKATFEADANGPAHLEIEWLPRQMTTHVTEHFINISGELEQRQVQDTVRAQFPALRRCYDDARTGDAGAKLYILPKFVIDEAGKVSSLRLGDGIAKPGPAESCMLGVFASMIFPKPTSGKVDIAYPVEFAWELE